MFTELQEFSFTDTPFVERAVGRTEQIDMTDAAGHLTAADRTDRDPRRLKRVQLAQPQLRPRRRACHAHRQLLSGQNRRDRVASDSLPQKATLRRIRLSKHRATVVTTGKVGRLLISRICTQARFHIGQAYWGIPRHNGRPSPGWGRRSHRLACRKCCAPRRCLSMAHSSGQNSH